MSSRPPPEAQAGGGEAAWGDRDEGGAQENLQAVLEGSPDMIVVVVDGKIVVANEAVASFAGWPTGAFIGASPLDFLHPEDRPLAVRRMGEVIGGGPGKTTAYRGVRGDGTIAQLEISSTLITYDGKPALVASIRDVTARLEANEKLRRSEERLRELLRHLQEVRESERREIARQLHDEVGSAMTALRMDLDWLQSQDFAESATVRARLEDMVEVVESAIDTGRRIATRLRPAVLDHLGLSAAVEWLAEDFRARTRIGCTLDMVDTGRPVDPDVATECFRIVQEALTNVIRHAEAGTVDIRVDLSGDPLRMEVTDDGRGIRCEELESPGSLGIWGMRERAGSVGGAVDIKQGASGGTTVSVTVPVAG